jgi:hypothetical protein
MLGSYLSPLAPAAVLLLSAFVLFGIIPHLPAPWRDWSGLKYVSAPVLVGIALGSLLFIDYDLHIGEQRLVVLSGWNFSSADSAALLTIRADSLSMSFLIVTLLAMLAVALLDIEFSDNAGSRSNQSGLVDWLMMSAAMCVLFVSANGLTIAYTIIVFDVVAALAWVRKRQLNLAVARLFLGILTATVSMLVTALADQSSVPVALFAGITLWLRLAIYPFVEMGLSRQWSSRDRLAYISLTTLVAMYLCARTVDQPLPIVIQWVTVITMLVASILSWLKVGFENLRTQQSSLLWLFLIEAQLVLLVAPLTTATTITFAVGFSLSFVALWVTPALGRPRFSETAWSWPYLPALFASLVLIGIPYSLGWPMRESIYQTFFGIDQIVFTGLLFIAESLALSGLVRFWKIVWSGNEMNQRRSIIGIMAMVPFLTPVLGLFILYGVTQIEALLTTVISVGTLVYILGLAGAAFGAEYHQFRILAPIDGSQLPIARYCGAVVVQIETVANGLSKFVLRGQIVLEGQHYLAWAIFAALLGALIILLD